MMTKQPRIEAGRVARLPYRNQRGGQADPTKGNPSGRDGVPSYTVTDILASLKEFAVRTML